MSTTVQVRIPGPPRWLAVPEIDRALLVHLGKPWNAAQPFPPGHTLVLVRWSATGDLTYTVP